MPLLAIAPLTAVVQLQGQVDRQLGFTSAAPEIAAGEVFVVRAVGLRASILMTAVDRGEGAAICCPVRFRGLRLEPGWLGREIECPRTTRAARPRVNPFVPHKGVW